MLRSGALPATLTIIEERTVGADLGADAIHSGTVAAVVGTILVILFMLFVYGPVFGGFASLVGAAMENNTFALTPSGSLAGSIQGGGDGTLVGATTATNWTISGAGSGTAGDIAFSGFANLVGAAKP